ncbi:acyloxyacyl hydrolase [Pontibacter sp. KCTC 32443]|uniref:acyloxyacyl hydrolase n=1 Tax=Pontibacter TaxID=323449 RepID=UPI00164DF647|nr:MULTISPECIES: acyloxyacyl hydrolase [Pontibacter]MBC5773119.1 acyloxyacyl hydrolase [Pontibacter sp. KCTC 32443]
MANAPPLYAFTTVSADTASRPAINLGVYSHYGFIIPHSEDIRQISNSNPWGVSIDLSFHFSDSLSWQYLQAYPRLGASFTYHNFNNPAVLGNGYSLILFVEPFLAAQHKFSISFRLGAGIAYLDNVYHPDSNPNNLFYSTKISFPLVANLMANYRLTKYLNLRAGGTYNHISNGGLRQPNKGINFPSATLGLDCALRPTYFAPRELVTNDSLVKFRHYLFAFLFTLKDRDDNPSDKLPVLGGNLYVSQKISRLSALTAGAEWVLDYTLKEKLQDQGQKEDFQRGALLAGHELHIGRFRFSQQLGIYVYAPAAARDPVYQRYGLEYHTPRKVFWGINLKAHRHVADFLDVRAGIKFP